MGVETGPGAIIGAAIGGIIGGLLGFMYGEEAGATLYQTVTETPQSWLGQLEWEIRRLYGVPF